MKKLDVVRLLDGRKGTVLESFDGGQKFMVEIADSSGKTIETPIVSVGDIAAVEYSA